MSAPTPIWKPSAPGLIEQAESGKITFAETATLTKVYKGKYADCFAGTLPRGTIGSSGITTGLIVQNCEVTPERGGAARLQIVWGGFSDTGGGPGTIVPADEFDLDPFELNPAVEKNPRFRDLYPEAPSLDLRKFQNKIIQATQGSTSDERDEFEADVYALMGSAEGDQAIMLLKMLKRGVTSFYLAGFRYSWNSYSFSMPAVTPGGFRSAPGGPMAAAISALNLSCLREADALGGAANGYYKLRRNWLCGPAGHWDSFLYP